MTNWEEGMKPLEPVFLLQSWPEFKKAAIALAQEIGARQAARRLQLGKTTLFRWLSEAREVREVRP